MITVEGLRLYYPGTELRAMSERALSYHASKLAELSRSREELASLLRKVAESRDPDAAQIERLKGYTSAQTADPIADLDNRIERHERLSRMHEHIRDHVDPEARYALHLSDLERWGVMIR